MILKKLNEGQLLTTEMGDITTYPGCIVNAANESLLGGGGVDGAIHRAAGRELLEACIPLGGCRTGEARITPGFKLKADYVIHTPGPIYSYHAHPEKLLESCYRNCMELAFAHDIHEIAFPGISTGVYGYPKKEASQIAVRTVMDRLKAHEDYPITVHFVCFSKADLLFYTELLA